MSRVDAWLLVEFYIFYAMILRLSHLFGAAAWLSSITAP